MNVVTEGDLGDAIYTLGIMAGIPGGPHRLLVRKSLLTKFRTDADVNGFVNLIKPLADKQEYIEECRAIRHGDVVDWDSSGFRLANMHNPTRTLLHAHWMHFKHIHPNTPCGDGSASWLKVTPSKESTWRVVVNRTDRYRNHWFPWRDVVYKYGDRIMFLGSVNEHEAFCNEYGKVPYHKTDNLLQVAELIAGSYLFIGNQSCANAIAEGLKHQTIQETSLDIPDCIFKRGNVQHVIDGSCVLPAIGVNELDTRLSRPLVNMDDIDQSTVPPKKWVVKCPDGTEERNVFLNILLRIGRNYGLTAADVLKQNAEEYRDYFFNSCYGSRLGMAKTAMANA